MSSVDARPCCSAAEEEHAAALPLPEGSEELLDAMLADADTDANDDKLAPVISFMALFSYTHGEADKLRFDDDEIVSLFAVSTATAERISTAGSAGNTAAAPTAPALAANPSTETLAVPLFSRIFAATKSPSITTAKATPEARLPSHPHKAILGSLQGLAVIAEKLGVCLSEQAPDGEKDKCPQIVAFALTILRHIEIFTRYEGNRDAMMSHGFLDAVLTILDLSGAAMIRLDDSETATDELLGVLTDLGNLTIVCMLVLSRCVDPRARWREWVRQAGNSASTISAPPVRDPRLDSKFFSRAAEIVTTILFYFSDAPAVPSAIIFSIRIFSLTTFGSLLVTKPTTVRRHLLKNEGLTRLAELLRRPPYFDDVAYEAIPGWKLRSEFKAQVLVWSIVDFLSRISGTSVRRMEQADGFRGVAFLLQWVSSVGERFDSPEGVYADFLEPISDLKLSTGPSWRDGLIVGDLSPVNILFSYALSMCLYPGNPIEAGADSISSPVVPQTPITSRRNESGREMASHVERILRILLRALRDLESLQSSKPVSATTIPIFELGLLQFLKIMLGLEDWATADAVPSVDVGERQALCLGWMEQLGVWTQVYSSRFILSPSPLSAFLSDAVKELTEGAVSVSQSFNTGAVSVLLDILCRAKKFNALTVSIRLDFCRYFRRLIHLHTDIVLNSMMRLDFLEPLFLELNLDNDSAQDESMRLALLLMLKEIIDTSTEMALYVSNNKAARTALMASYVKANEGMSEVKSEGEKMVCAIVLAVTSAVSTSFLPVATTSTEVAELVRFSHSSEWMSQFFACFPRDEIPFRTPKLVFSLLHQLQSLINTFPPGSRSRRLLRRSLISFLIFENVLSLFNINFLDDNNDVIVERSEGVTLLYHELCASIFLTLARIISSDDYARSAFKEMQGYEEMRRRVFVKGNWSPWPNYIACLFGLMVPQWMPDQRHNIPGPIVIRNPDVVDALLSLQPHLPEALMIDVLDKIEILAKGHEMNRVVLTTVGLPMLLLRKVLPECRSERLIERTATLFQVNTICCIFWLEGKM
ncbi:hypothetical protein HK101_005724 [Irineochytrium annulatum]|nr:hypothetical protein HK101_005724 [Irineochytrium annulatum]